MDEFRRAARVMADDCLCFRARRVARMLTRLYDEALRPLGIQATQLTLLNAIALGGDDGGMMGPLAEILAMDATTLSRNLRPLEKAGLVRIAPSATDRRVRLVCLTAEGRRMVAEALPLWSRAQGRVVEQLGPEAAADLRDRFDATVPAPLRPDPAHP